MKKVIITLLKLVCLIALLVAFAGVGFIGYNELQGSNAKKYLIRKYNLNEWTVFAISAKEYVYEKEAECSTLWLKKCTDDETLARELVFITLDGVKIEVTELVNGEFEDNYKNDEEKEKKDN